MNIQLINPATFANLVSNGYATFDIEPNSTGKELFWLHINQYDANHTLVHQSDYTCLVNVKQEKQLRALHILDKPYSKLNLPIDKTAQQLHKYLEREDVKGLPIFGYGVAQTDIPVLDSLLPNYQHAIYDLGLTYATLLGTDILSLDDLAFQLSLGTSPRQPKSGAHSPIVDAELTNYVLQGMLGLAKGLY